ncbi:MAG: fumarate hydratase C-terminal domain-containing protein, partial [Rhizobiaceae bacterium]
MENAAKPKQIRLSTTPARGDLESLALGDIVYLDGLIYTGREGVYTRALEEHVPLPMDLPRESAANFHCSPAAAIEPDGSYKMGAVTATASFRFSKWIGEWL